jgi:signal transduction histidine kinase
LIQTDPDENSVEHQQLLIYAHELNALHQQQRQQIQELQKLYSDLQIKEQHRACLMNQLLTAQEQERRRIARDIHDGPLQDLGVLLLSIERCKRQIEAGLISDALTGLANLRQDGQQAIHTLRGLVNYLRPSILDTYGLLGALDHLAGQLGRDTDITINVSSRLGCRLDSNLEVLIFRLTQEALNNIRKHAQADYVWITVQRQGAELLIDIRDDGQGFVVETGLERALATGHLGLASMHERVELAGGRLTIQSAPDEGTALCIVLPFQALATEGYLAPDSTAAPPTTGPAQRARPVPARSAIAP